MVDQQKIAYTMEDGRKAVITFSGDNGTTLVTVTFDAEKVNAVEMQKEGWQAILNRFKQYVEKSKALPFHFTVPPAYFKTARPPDTSSPSTTSSTRRAAVDRSGPSSISRACAT